MFHRLVILGLLILASACASKPKQPVDKDAITVAGGLALVKDGDASYQAISGRLAATPLTDRQAGYKAGMDESHRRVYTGAVGMAKPCQDAIAANDRSREGFYRWTDKASFIGGIALAVGIALIVMGVVNGAKIGLGVGIAVLGGSLVAVFLTIRSAAPVLPWVMAGVGALALLGFGYFVYERIAARRERVRREKQLADERKATIELVKTVDAVAELVPPEAKPNLFKRIANDIQSSTTEKLVREAKGEPPKPESDVKSAAEATVQAAEATVSAAEKSDVT